MSSAFVKKNICCICRAT